MLSWHSGGTLLPACSPDLLAACAVSVEFVCVCGNLLEQGRVGRGHELESLKQHLQQGSVMSKVQTGQPRDEAPLNPLSSCSNAANTEHASKPYSDTRWLRVPVEHGSCLA